jgi:hypothetical protein
MGTDHTQEGNENMTSVRSIATAEESAHKIEIR